MVKDEKKIKTLQNEVTIAFGVILCGNALNADALQGTWQALDTLAVSLGKPAVFGPQTTTVNDSTACDAFKVTRSHAIPPNVSVFSSLALSSRASAHEGGGGPPQRVAPSRVWQVP